MVIYARKQKGIESQKIFVFNLCSFQNQFTESCRMQNIVQAKRTVGIKQQGEKVGNF